MDITRFTAVRPHERQIMWQELGFTAFLHFGMNTFTNREWGEGDESPDIYAPAALNTDQWCEALRPAGIKACILTAKHHDGFCLWDTAYTRHGVMSSSVPVDVAASLAASCRRYGMKLGIYLSPWDRHEPSYGTGKPYDDFFCGQLDELTTQYGELYCCWFDGACGEKNGKVQNYDWERYFSIIRKNQPNAVISVMGPDVRWIGNEAGLTRKSEWSVVSTRLQNSGAIAARSQQADGLPPLSLEDEDLGSAAALENEPELCWYPAEVNVSIRPGWFYHPEENGCLRSVADLLGIYEASVGGNALLLLNVPPDKNGQINGADALRLKELGEALSAAYGRNLCLDAIISDSDGNDMRHTLEDDDSFWRGGGETAAITITFPQARTVGRLELCEQIRESQRIEAFEVIALTGHSQKIIFSGTTVGFRKICRFDPVEVSGIKIIINRSREWPTIRFAGAY